MPFKFNPTTGQLDLVSNLIGFVRGPGPSPGTSTDKAIVRWQGTDGSTIQNSKTILQDGGAIEAQAFITRTSITDDVVVHTGQAWIAPSIELDPNGSVVLEADSELIIV